MEVTNLNIKIRKDIKETAEEIFGELGMNMATAINIFLRQSIRENGIPFELRLDQPNRITMDAIEEGRRLAMDTSVKGYTSINELKAALEE